jgi:tight adherence protein B
MTAPRPAVAAAGLAAALALASAAGAAEGSLELREAGGTHFPDRAYVLTLPSGMYLDADRVQVRENGELVKGLSIVPAGAVEAGQFAVVLVIDASQSMAGRPIEDAVAAAQAFAAQRNENQTLAIVLFNGQTRVLLPFTRDAVEIDEALASPPALARGTHIYDGVGTALDLLAAADVAAGSIVVLSDGADTGSAVTLANVTERARGARVRVFTVGLRSPSFSAGPLEALAGDAHGAYSEAASSGDLESLFDQLGSMLANEYLVRYRSQASPRTTVHVSARVEDVEGLGESQYVSPALSGDPGAPFHRSFAERFWRSPAGMLAAGLASAAFLGLALVALLHPRARTLRKRMSEFVSLPLPEERAGASQRDLALARAEKSLERARWWSRFKEELELAGIRTPAGQIVLATAAGTLVAAWILFAVGGPFVALLGLGLPFFVRSMIRRKLERKRNLFADQLPDNLQVLASALRAGHSMVGALSVVVDDCPEPSRGEFRRIVADEQLGVPLDEAFMVVARRMSSRDLEQVALVANLQRETGGNTAEVLDRVGETIRGRFELRRLVRTLTTQGRMSRWVVSLLPVGLLALITLINPEYMRPLYVHPVGRVLLVLAGVMVVAGSLVIKRIINIKV